MKSRASVSASA